MIQGTVLPVAFLAENSLVVAFMPSAVEPITVTVGVVIVFIPVDLVHGFAVLSTDTICAGLGSLELVLSVVVVVSLVP